MISRSSPRFPLVAFAALLLSVAVPVTVASVTIAASPPSALATASVTYMATPFWSSPLLVGGEVEVWTAGSTDTLIVGDVVYVSSAGTVKRATSTTATHLASVGVVVGGTSTSMKGITDSATVAANTRAALPGANVLVLRRGKMWMRADTGAGGTIAAGARLRPPTYITGRAYGWALVASDSLKTFGTAIRAATPGNIFLGSVSSR